VGWVIALLALIALILVVGFALVIWQLEATAAWLGKVLVGMTHDLTKELREKR
jgi:hypothetical protein